MPGWAIALAGFLTGAVAGYSVHRARLCSFGAIESALMGSDWRRMKVFALALAIAIAGTQAVILAGWLDPTHATYIPDRVALFSALCGSFMFGIGMAFVGTCAFGSLVRLGSGDLRSFISTIMFGAIAYATLRGVLAPLRIDVLEKINIAMPTGYASELAVLASLWTGRNVRLVLTAVIVLSLVLWALRDKRLFKTPRLLAAGVTLGLLVVAGWLVTGVLSDSFDENLRVQSLTFVAPVARALFGFIGRHSDWMDFGVMTVPGVVIGAFIHAKQNAEFRWEAYDDHHEMRRHLIGAALMGFGGVLAGGCTIGQGLTAGSLLAVTWPVTVAGLFAGARLGIAILVEGSLKELLQNHLAARRGD